MTSANKYWRRLVQTRTRFETVLLVFLVLIVASEVSTLLSFSLDFVGDSHISFNLLAIALFVMFMVAYSKRPPADERDPAR